MTAPTGAPEQSEAAPVARNSFVRAAIEHTQQGSDISTLMKAGSGTRVGPIDVPAYGYMRNLVLLVQCSGAAGGAGGLKADAPWNILEQVTLTDVNGTPILIMSGYELYLLNKWGGHRFGQYDPAVYPSYSANALNPSFKLIIPIEITPRDAIGSLPNLTASQTYKLTYTVAPGSSVYSTVPSTTYPTVRVQMFLEAWSQPADTDVRGIPNEVEPPYLGTTMYTSVATYPVTIGQNRIQLKRVGNLLRNQIFIFRDAAGARDSTNFPAAFRREVDSRILEESVKDLWLDTMRDRWNLAADTGVFPITWTHDGDGRPGNETRNLYMATSGATRYDFVGSFGAAGALTVITQDVAPQGGAALASGYAR